MQAERITENPADADELRRIVEQVMEIAAILPVSPDDSAGVRIRGRLRVDPAAAYAYLAPRFQLLGYTALVQRDHEGAAVVAAPGSLAASPSRLWLALLTFALTVASTVFVGGFTVDGFNPGLGLAYSAALLSILLAHELGHFLMARRLGVAVSYPFFIPLPIPPLGTMGAFIAMKAPPPDRRALLAIALAGPLAGLLVAIPVLVIGLLMSEVQPLIVRPGEQYIMEGNSLLYAAIKVLLFGRFLPGGGEDILLHPVAFAGWAGLLVTGLNLIPAGQLDGGHIFYALVGKQGASIATWVVAAALLAIGFLWNGWFLWAALIVLFGQQRAPLLNELTPLDWRSRLLAIFGLIVFVLVFTPNPLTIFP